MIPLYRLTPSWFSILAMILMFFPFSPRIDLMSLMCWPLLIKEAKIMSTYNKVKHWMEFLNKISTYIVQYMYYKKSFGPFFNTFSVIDLLLWVSFLGLLQIIHVSYTFSVNKNCLYELFPFRLEFMSNIFGPYIIYGCFLQ